MARRAARLPVFAESAPRGRFTAPQPGHPEDMRCAFVTKFDEPEEHSKLTLALWCPGCRFYICDHCRKAVVQYDHTVLDHHPLEAIHDDRN